MNVSRKSDKSARILFLDIETSPILAHVWQLFDNNVSLNQVVSDWHLLSWSAKWADEDKIIYMDQRNAKDIQDDKALLEGVWKLLDAADVVIWQNGDHFDKKKLNARFILTGLKPPSSYRTIDTYKLAKKHFGFTSNKLEYMSKKLNQKYKKQDHKKFPGHELWVECLKGNKDAWKEMEKYNKHDVLALEEVYKRLLPWDNTINFNVYHDDFHHICSCGCKEFVKNGYYFTETAKYQRFKCKDCSSETRDNKNLLIKEKKESLKRKTAK